MSKMFSGMNHLSKIVSVFFPELPINRLEFNEKNAKNMLFKCILIVDGILKAENLYKKRNIFLIENNYWLSLEPIKALDRIAIYLRKFEPLAFKMSKTDRQTFIFVVENIIDYLKRDNLHAEKSDRKKLFTEYRFWIENFFKLLEQKIHGDIELIKSIVDDSNLKYNEIENFYYSNDKINIPLFPFVFNFDSTLFFTSEVKNNGVSLYDDTKNENILIRYKDLDNSLYEFFVLNLRLYEGEILKKRVDYEDDILDGNFKKVNSAVMHSNKKQYFDSYNLLSMVSLDILDHPLLYLFQIRNLAYLNKIPETKKLLEKFLTLFPYYSEGYELLGDIHAKDGEYEHALVQYKKSLGIFQNKIISEKIKKCGSLLRSKEDSKKINRDESFFDISAEEFRNETRVLFRQKEINQMIEILCSDSKNNVLIVGESGVGKTYLIKYLAQQILKSEVPEALLKKKIKEINFISLLTGSKYRGQFEEKGVRLLKDLKGAEVILVLEDIHLMMNSGAIRGTSLDFINILKPFLRDNSVQIIATTNGEEFKNTVERDNSLIGFFQKISINQMTEFETQEILKYRASQLSSKHSLIISTELVNEIVKMAKSNIRNRMLPDSAVMLLERCVSKRVHKNFVSNNYEPELSVEILSEVLSDILNLPESFLSISIKEKLSSLRDILSETIKGQDEALDKLVKGVIASKLGFDINDNRPDGVFLFIGPTGVGKTQTAISLANALYGSDDYLIRLDMSEYMEKYTYSRFVGAAPGYVGYNDTNQLTDKVRKNPSSVILIDEVEKGDNQLLNIFLQIFDAGRLTDSKGNVVDFSNTTIIMTSNVGTDLYSKVRLGYQRDVLDKSVSRLSLNKSLKKFFSPEFLNRIDEIIVFDQLSKDEIVEIIREQLKTIKEKMFKKGKDLMITDDVIELIATKGYSKEYGARNISREIKIVLLEKIAELSLTDEWAFCDAVVCEVEEDEIIVKLLKAEVHLEDKDVDSFKKMGSLNVR